MKREFIRGAAVAAAMSAGIAGGCASGENPERQAAPTTEVRTPRTIQAICVTGIKEALANSESPADPEVATQDYQETVRQSRKWLVDSVVAPLASCVDVVKRNEDEVQTDFGTIYISKGDGNGPWVSTSKDLANGDEVTVGWVQDRTDNSVGTIYVSLTTPDKNNPDHPKLSDEQAKASADFTEYQYDLGGGISCSGAECPPPIRRDDVKGFINGKQYSTLGDIDHNAEGLNQQDGALQSVVAVGQIIDSLR
jgi:hypothetical protein